MKAKLRIFLADDHAMLRKGLEVLINAQSDMEVVGEANDGQEACQKVRQLQPDVVVMDLSMPNLDGLQATTALKQVCPQIKILILTVREDTDSLRALFKVGASGYVLKNAVAEELTQAIRRIADGGIYLDPSLAAKLIDTTMRRSTQRSGGEGEVLSERELEVLRLLAWGHNNAEIASRLHLSVRTVETYKARSMEKLGLQSRVDIVRYAVRRGWLQEN
jgi:DNA-binding NarL/FixJ family response regulator